MEDERIANEVTSLTPVTEAMEVDSHVTSEDDLMSQEQETPSIANRSSATTEIGYSRSRLNDPPLPHDGEGIIEVGILPDEQPVLLTLVGTIGRGLMSNLDLR